MNMHIRNSAKYSQVRSVLILRSRFSLRVWLASKTQKYAIPQTTAAASAYLNSLGYRSYCSWKSSVTRSESSIMTVMQQSKIPGTMASRSYLMTGASATIAALVFLAFFLSIPPLYFLRLLFLFFLFPFFFLLP